MIWNRNCGATAGIGLLHHQMAATLPHQFEPMTLQNPADILPG